MNDSEKRIVLDDAVQRAMDILHPQLNCGTFAPMAYDVLKKARDLVNETSEQRLIRVVLEYQRAYDGPDTGAVPAPYFERVLDAARAVAKERFNND